MVGLVLAEHLFSMEHPATRIHSTEAGFLIGLVPVEPVQHGTPCTREYIQFGPRMEHSTVLIVSNGPVLSSCLLLFRDLR